MDKDEVKVYFFYPPDDKFHDMPLFAYVLISELKVEEQELVKKWLYGQTVPSIPDHPDAMYAHDYNRWHRLHYIRKVV